MISSLIIVGVALILAYSFLVRKLSYWKKLGVPQRHPLYLFYFGWFRFFKKETPVEFFQSFANTFPEARYYGYHMFGKKVINLHDDELVKLITVKDADHFTDRMTFIPEDIDPLWGKNLFALQGQRWREMRVTLSPSFTGSKIKGMFVLMNDCAEKFVQYFMDSGEKLHKVDFKGVCSRYCSDIIASVAFGVEVDSMKHPYNEFYKYAMEATNFRTFWKSIKFIGFFMSPTLYKFSGLKFFSDDVGNFFRNIINEGINLREEKGLVRNDLIHLLMEARKGSDMKDCIDTADPGFATVQETINGRANKGKMITNEDITAQALIFFFAGYDSVSNAMSFMAHELAENPDIQDRLREEILEIYERSNETLKYDHIVNMEYMDMVVSETLRKWPVMAAYDRVCTQPYTIEPALPGGKPLELQIGHHVEICSYNFHHNPKYFPNPEKFDPERFNVENKKNIKPYAYIPFGSGMRNCIGSRFALMEIKVLFIHILKNFEIVPVKETNIPMVLQSNKMGFLPKNGFQLGFKRIDN